MEWMPIRRGPAAMGVVEITSITQVIEWGSLASIVAVDGRMTDRSAEPTLKESIGSICFCSLRCEKYFCVLSRYYDETSEIRQTFDYIAQGLKTDMDDPTVRIP